MDDKTCDCEGSTESVEQVVREMLRCIWQLTEADGECCGSTTSETPACERAFMWHEPCYKAFSERLQALGVFE